MEVNKKQLLPVSGTLVMTVETARRILAAAPQSAQARSDTALDRLMQGAPAPLAAGIGAHTHSVAIGSHGHTITVNAAGNAENTVKNIAFNYIVRLA
ncbi:hypothetical protein QHY17_004481 [Escherichia coli]|nr:hypothetical protein [Escherichia coli]EKY2612933.1 hypothetical protein [Escherichia coli]